MFLFLCVFGGLVGYDEGNRRDSLGDEMKKILKGILEKFEGRFYFIFLNFEIRSYGKLSDWTC
jgi:hypothetical protein